MHDPLRPAPKALLFDYGNTLIPFGAREIADCDAALAEALRNHFGQVDGPALQAIRERNRMAPYQGDPPAWRENDFEKITREMVAELYDAAPPPSLLERLLAVRRSAFLAVVRAPAYLDELLARLAARFPLALVSNYPDGGVIRESMERIGIARHFAAIVVSGDLGRCKPHPAPFQAACTALGVTAHEACFVGDNWLADIQGAKRAGMRAVLTRQWRPPERFDPAPGDHAPDAIIAALPELEPLLSP